MPSYEITAVSDDTRAWKAQGKYDMVEYRVDLKGPNSDGAIVDVPNVEWSRKKESPAPRVGQKLDVEKFETKQQGLKLHLSQQLGGGYRSSGSGGESKEYKADPVKQAAIAMEASQKAAVEIAKLKYAENLDGDKLTEAIRLIAAQLYEQIQQAMRDAG